MIGDYDWNEILEFMKKFALVEDINDIVLIGEKDGIRRIKLWEVKDDE